MRKNLYIALITSTLVMFSSSLTAEEIERYEYHHSSETACSKATDKAHKEAIRECKYKGGIKTSVGSGCITSNVSSAFGGKKQYKATKFLNVICNK